MKYVLCVMELKGLLFKSAIQAALMFYFVIIAIVRIKSLLLL